MDKELILMQRIRVRWGKTIAAACHLSAASHLSSVPPEFLAALTANESGGDPNAFRFEPHVYTHLLAVSDGRRASYGEIARSGIVAEEKESARDPELPWCGQSRHTGEYHAMFLDSLSPEWLNPQAVAIPRMYPGMKIPDNLLSVAPARQDIDDCFLRDLATSWGLTQIMGYHMVGRPGTVAGLIEPAHHHYFALQLLGEFAEHYGLDLRAEFEGLFRCWNTGRPDGKCYAADYVSKGLARAETYKNLALGAKP